MKKIKYYTIESGYINSKGGMIASNKEVFVDRKKARKYYKGLSLMEKRNYKMFTSSKSKYVFITKFKKGGIKK